MRITYFTHKGNVREKNEDALALEMSGIITTIGKAREKNEDLLPVLGKAITEDTETPCEIVAGGENSLSAFVIDGMGGHIGSKHASTIVAETLAVADIENLLNNVRGVFESARQKMREAAEENQELSKMGATLAGIVLYYDSAMGATATVFNCGDCRVYRFRGGFLDKLTHDHSRVQELFDAGIIDDDQMRHHTQKNVVTSALMPFDDFEIYTHSYTIEEEDIFFVCSDGVWETVSLDEIEKCLSTGQDLSRYLLDNAPCGDNISYIIIEGSGWRG